MNKDRPLINVIAVIMASVISFFMVTFGKGKNSAGLTYLAMIWMPFAIGAATLGLYFLSRKFTNKNNWILSVLGILLILALGLSVLFDW